MAIYRYKAATVGGEVLEGRMEAASQEAVIRQLQAQGHVPIRAEEITPGAETKRRPARAWQRRRPGRADVSVFTVELATLLQAGLPLDKALEMLANLCERPAFAEVLVKLHAEVRGGAFLSRALEAEPRLFSRFYRNMVKAGEAGGALDAALARLAEFMERSRELRDAVVSALLYPMVLVVVAFLSILIILGFVVPRVSGMFAEAGRSLPWFTQVVVATGSFVQDFWWLFVVAIVGAWLYMRAQYANPASRLRWDRRWLSLPLVGDAIAKLEAARFTRTLGTLVASGVPLLDAIAIAREVIANRVISEAIAGVAERVRQGEGLARPLTETGVFPPLAGHLMQVGEETGNLEAMLLKLAEIYDREVRSSMRRLMTVLEPALILGLAVVIAAIIMSIVMAVLSINDLAL